MALGAASFIAAHSPRAWASEPDAGADVASEVDSDVPTPRMWTQQAPSAPAIAPPRWNGNTLFITGAVTAAVSMAMHGLAAHVVQRDCTLIENPSDLLPSRIRDLGIGDVLDASFLSRIDVICSPTVGIALATRVLVPVFSAGALAQVGVGGAFRGHHLAYQDVFGSGRRRSFAVTAGLGATLMLAGAALWAGSRASLFENHTGCDSIGCFAWYEFGTYQASALLFTAGTGLFAQGMAFRGSRRRYEAWKNIGVKPLLARDRAGFTVEGRF